MIKDTELATVAVFITNKPWYNAWWFSDISHVLRWQGC